eukprot:3123011-Rhodomonas_salina.1
MAQYSGSSTYPCLVQNTPLCTSSSCPLHPSTHVPVTATQRVRQHRRCDVQDPKSTTDRLNFPTLIRNQPRSRNSMYCKNSWMVVTRVERTGHISGRSTHADWSELPEGEI